MGLNSSMQKIIQFTQKFSNSLNPDNLINIKIPGGAVADFLGFEEGEGIHSIADLKWAVMDASANVATGINLVRCGIHMAGNGFEGYLGFLGQMAMGATAIIAAITDQVIEAIALQINMAISQVIGTITNIIKVLHDLWNSVKMIWQSLQNLWDSWTADINFDLELELDEENCKYMFAAIAGCMLNKFLGPYIDEFREKTLNAINEAGADFNSMLYDELSDANTFAAYAEHEAFLCKKAALQINGLNRQNLLGV